MLQRFAVLVRWGHALWFVCWLGCGAATDEDVEHAVVVDSPGGERSSEGTVETVVVQGAASEARPCRSTADCPEPAVCAMSECGAEGRCQEDCVVDHVPYCGCDGQTFMSSSTCPASAYRARGECGAAPALAEAEPSAALETEPSASETTADQTTCASAADCPEGQMCHGDPGCGAAWHCVPAGACTRDLVTYCACDGTEFRSSGSCPGRPYARRGTCAGDSSGANL